MHAGVACDGIVCSPLSTAATPSHVIPYSNCRDSVGMSVIVRVWHVRVGCSGRVAGHGMYPYRASHMLPVSCDTVTIES